MKFIESLKCTKTNIEYCIFISIITNQQTNIKANAVLKIQSNVNESLKYMSMLQNLRNLLKLFESLKSYKIIPNR